MLIEISRYSVWFPQSQFFYVIALITKDGMRNHQNLSSLKPKSVKTLIKQTCIHCTCKSCHEKMKLRMQTGYGVVGL